MIIPLSIKIAQDVANVCGIVIVGHAEEREEGDGRTYNLRTLFGMAQMTS